MFGVEAKLAILEQLTRHPPELPNEEELMVSLRQKLGPHADQSLLLQHLRESRGKLHWAVNSYFRGILGSPSKRGSREDFQSKPCSQRKDIRHAHGSCSTGNIADICTANSSRTASNSGSSSSSSGAATLPADTTCNPSSTQQCSGMADLGSKQAAVDHRAACLEDGGAACTTTRCLDAAAEASGMSTASADRAESSEKVIADTAAVPSVSSVSLADGLPAFVVEEVLKHLDVASLCSVASTCTALRKATQSEALWGRLFLQRWGDVVFPLDGPPSNTARAQQHFVPHVWLGNTATTQLAQHALEQQQQQQQHPQARDEQQEQQHGSKQQHPDSQQMGPSPAQQAATVPSSLTHTVGAQASSSNPASAEQPQPKPLASRVGMVPPPPSAKNRRSGWRGLYRRQHGYQTALRCPRCGVGRILPLVYGFPSPALISGMPTRLMLGGDHLIDEAFVWACPACRACYKTYPFENVQLWLQDDAERLQRQQSASSSRGIALAANAGLPQYTYEL